MVRADQDHHYCHRWFILHFLLFLPFPTSSSHLSRCRQAREEVRKETKDLVDTINNEIEKIGLDISKLNEADLDLKSSLEDIIKKMENLVRYSKGEIHKVIIY